MPKHKRLLATEELRNPPDEQIDFSDIPATTREFWKGAKVIFPEKKAPEVLRAKWSARTGLKQ